MIGRTLAEAAAQEAFEEAGVEGQIEDNPVGWLTHDKQHVVLGQITVRIAVHRLAVERELAHWPEAGQRKRRWFTPERAAEHVNSPDLARMIQQLKTAARRQEWT
jgi:8-oxo-dGTP pyrophosphatase MutT (NUDIX family)